MPEPGVCESEVDGTALFPEFGVALNKRLQRSRGKRRKRDIKRGDCGVKESLHTGIHLFSNISTMEVTSAGT